MTRPAEHPGAARLSVMVQLVGSVCAVLLALSLALAATLLREGHFAACIENSGYLDTLHTAVLDTCGGYAAAAGTTADPLADIITPEAVRAGVLHRADGLWHGSTVDETDPFNDLIVTDQDNVAPEPAVYDGYRILQYNCQMEWKSAMATPFSAAISMVLQYRTVVAVTMYLSALLLVGCIALQYRLAARWRVFCHGLLHMADACLLAGAVLAGWLGFGSGYRSWTAVGDIGYTLFCRWFGALAPAVLGCAALVAAIPTGLVFWVCVQYHRAKAQRPSCKTEKPVL